MDGGRFFSGAAANLNKIMVLFMPGPAICEDKDKETYARRTVYCNLKGAGTKFCRKKGPGGHRQYESRQGPAERAKSEGFHELGQAFSDLLSPVDGANSFPAFRLLQHQRADKTQPAAALEICDRRPLLLFLFGKNT